MRKFILLITSIILLASPALAAKTVTVKPYITKQGVYKPPSYRTAPNATKIDNFSSKGNINPYTGKTGTVDAFKSYSSRK